MTALSEIFYYLKESISNETISLKIRERIHAGFMMDNKNNYG